MDIKNTTPLPAGPQVHGGVNPAIEFIKSYHPRQVLPISDVAKVLNITPAGLRKALVEKRVELPFRKILGGIDGITVGDLAKFLYPHYFSSETNPETNPASPPGRGRGRPRKIIAGAAK